MSKAPDGKYCALLKRLYGLTRFGEKYDLTTPESLARGLGWPLAKYDSILIGGTNGKGSTSAFTETLLRAKGLRTGLFTSPHLISFTERIRIDGEPIEHEWLINHGHSILDLAETLSASFFEAAWAMAMMAFRDFEVDVAIWEVGLGGRLDATNVADPVVSAIVSVDMDHTQILGDSLTKIAQEKSAIYRPDRPALTCATGAGLEALRAVGPSHLHEVDVHPDLPELPLPGEHQRRNASLAMAIVQSLGIETKPADLLKTQWPARCERIGPYILDCAHNPAAMRVLGDWLTHHYSAPIHAIFGVMEGKDVRQLVETLESWAQSVALVTPSYPRRLTAENVRPFFTHLEPTLAKSLTHALKCIPNDHVAVVCGSGFLAGEARAVLMGLDYPECGLVTSAR